MINDPIAAWHEVVKSGDPAALDALLDEDVVFHSPIVHSARIGKSTTSLYLSAALEVFRNPSFRYVRELKGPGDAVLEFMLEIDGIEINGVDMIRWNTEGRIVDFKVMLRPLKAVNLIHEKMAARLEVRTRR